ncbi:hypothetical protein PV783_32945 [Chitinophaga sp. CC14]|uniref:hypothetical protein n=1 Tax=Chitinophaga sp. CC14 TaxID=3029199 RepID=UPI003B7C3114
MKQDLIDDILNEPTSYITSKWIIERIPFVFNNDLSAYIDWKERLSTLIQVDSKAFVFTGSSSVGFSLNPFKDLRPFDDQSDIDVAIISGIHFDIAWHFLRNIGPKYHRLKPKEKGAIDDHKGRLIFHGTIATDKIVQLLPFGIDWVNAMSVMSKIAPTIDRTINFRIYKDFEALKAYQKNGVNKIRDKLLNPQE